MKQPYALETLSECPLCHSDGSRSLFEISPYGYRICNRCDLVWLSPRIASSDLDRFYNEEYREVYAGNLVPLHEQLKNPTFAFRERRLAKYSPGRGFFEIGCGDGNFLAVLRKHGWEVAGSDVSLAAAEVARVRHRLNIEIVPLNSFRLPNTYDAIGLYHVMEHIYDPQTILEEIHRALQPGGILHFQMPNRHSIDGRLGRQFWGGSGVPSMYFSTSQSICNFFSETVSGLFRLRPMILGIAREQLALPYVTQ